MEELLDSAGIHGVLHRPPGPAARGAIALAHGAGSDCRSPLLSAVANALAEAGMIVWRYDLPFRRDRPSGPPSPAGAARDREGIRQAVAALRGIAGGKVLAGGHSYGGRQATMAAAEDPTLADALLLLSYPLHPPRKPEQLRTAHFPRLKTPALFVHGTRDPFGSVAELRAALSLIPGRVELLEVEGAGHDLRKLRGGMLAPSLTALLSAAR